MEVIPRSHVLACVGIAIFALVRAGIILPYVFRHHAAAILALALVFPVNA